MKPVVLVRGVSKKYSRNANSHLSYGISDLFAEILGRRKDLTLRKDEFWAVDNATFYMNRGDSLAIIGPNGSGKTTLLKIMNGLVKLDAGLIAMEGRTQALINLGAGFNPALSGRDNVFNSASLMGLSGKETRRILDEVVDFAELEEFIDSPVGTYSSGMKARLGFSVAINLKPDVLLIDEILSVGDQSFRNKCFIKMHQMKKQGVTIVLVSHALTHVMQICERALWLNKGKVMKLGPAKETVQAYLDHLDEQEEERVRQLNALKAENLNKDEAKAAQLEKRVAGESIHGPIYDEFDRIQDLEVAFLHDGEETDSVRVHDEVVIEYSFRLVEPVTDLNVTLRFAHEDGLVISGISTLNEDLLKGVHAGEVRCRVVIPDLNLVPGSYVLVMPIHEGKSYLYRDIVKRFVVTGMGGLTWGVMDFKYDYHVDGPTKHAKHASFT